MRIKSGCLAVMMVLACALAACGGGSNSGADAGASAGSPSTSTSTPESGGTLTVAYTDGIPQLNPVIRTFAAEEVLFPLMWTALSKTDENGEIVPDLAKSWDVSTDQRTWTFELRDAKFSDGSPITAEDVVKVFDYYRDPKTATQERNKVEPIASIKATDDTHVEIRLKAPNAQFPAAIVWVKIIDVDNVAKLDKEPVVSGPYTVKDFVPSDHVTLERNPEYFGDEGVLDEIRIVKASDATAGVTALRSGSIDGLWSPNPADVASIESDTNLQVIGPKAPSKYVDWEMDTTSPPFDDVRARQAVAYATDRNAVLENAYYGLGDVSPTNDPLSTKNPFYGGQLNEYGYDLAKAKELFAAAGIKEGSTITWWGTAGSNPEWTTAAQILQASLKEIGITLKIENREVSTWADRFYPAGKKFPNMIVPNLVSFPPGPTEAISFYLKGRCECNWDNPEFEQAYADAMAEADETAAKEKWGKVQEIINEEVPLIIPLQVRPMTALRHAVAGAWMESGGQLHLEQAGLAPE
jgi:peptide/nickel transport system substrate-binding protein